MTAVISMLRGVNVGGNNMIKMEALRALYASLGLRDAQSYIQSGNVVFRTEQKDVAPLAKRNGIEPGKLSVSFLVGDPAAADRELLRKMKFDPEELHIGSRHLYVYFPAGMGQTKLNMKMIDRTLKTSGTWRNWNSVLKLLEMAGG